MHTINHVIKTNNNKSNTTLNKRQLWDVCKINIKETTIAFCTNKCKNQKNEIVELEKRLKNGEDGEIEKQLEDLYEKRAVGAQVRARAKWIEHGEKQTKYFF